MIRSAAEHSVHARTIDKAEDLIGIHAIERVGIKGGRVWLRIK